MTEEKHTSLSDLGDYKDHTPKEMKLAADAFYNLIRKRHSIRDFSTQAVPQEILETCIQAAGTAPSGANHQPWHFALVGNSEIKRQIRHAAEEEERAFYSGKAGEEWLSALAPIGTDANKPHLEDAPWLICIFAQRRGGLTQEDTRKNYYVTESVGIACGILITALHKAGLTTLTHTPNPMTFLNQILKRPKTEKPFLILVVGKPAKKAAVPNHALQKKALNEIMSVF